MQKYVFLSEFKEIVFEKNVIPLHECPVFAAVRGFV
jgi:hypothetical protein